MLLNKGVWPTMITPFTKEGKIDYEATEKLIEWYIQEGVDGIFAVCQSSEMIYLTLEERIALAEFVVEKVNKRVNVVASGHISESLEDQIKELKAMSQTGIDALVLVNSRIVKENESDEVFKERLLKIVENIPENIKLGFYECPVPYKRIIGPDLLKWIVSLGRFYFLKDTSCDADIIKAKIDAVEGTDFQIYNANTATLLTSIDLGCYGFNGVMANFHPKLYKKMLELKDEDRKKSQEIMDFLSLASLVEYQNYPMNAKYHLKLCGLDIELVTRKECKELTVGEKLQVKALHDFADNYIKAL